MDMPASRNSIVIYEGKEGQPKIEVRIDGETVWLNQIQLVELFQSSKANVSEHIKNIFTESELSPEATVRKFRTVQKEGTREVAREVEVIFNHADTQKEFNEENREFRFFYNERLNCQCHFPAKRTAKAIDEILADIEGVNT